MAEVKIPTPLNTTQMEVHAQSKITELAAGVADEAEKKALTDRALAAFKASTGNELKGARAEFGLNEAEAKTLADKIYTAVAAKMDDKEVGQEAAKYITTTVDAKITTFHKDVIAAAQAADNTLSGASTTDFTDKAKAAMAASRAEIDVAADAIASQKIAEEALKQAKGIQANTAKVEAATTAAGDQLGAMQVMAKSVVDDSKFSAAIDARLAVVAEVESQAAATKAAGTTGLAKDVVEANNKTLAGLRETAGKAEEAASALYTEARKTEAFKGKEDAFDKVMQATMDAKRATEPKLGEDWKKILAAKESTKLGKLGEMLGSDRFAAAGIATDYTKATGAALEGGDGMGWGGKAVAGAAAVAAGFAAVKTLGSMGGSTDPQTGEKKESSMFAKVTKVVMGAVLAAAAVIGVAAVVKGGNPLRALSEGEGIGKITDTWAAAVRSGKYAAPASGKTR